MSADFKKYAKLTLSGDITVWCEKCNAENDISASEGSIWEKSDYANKFVKKTPNGEFAYYTSKYHLECEECENDLEFELHTRVYADESNAPDYILAENFEGATVDTEKEEYESLLKDGWLSISKFGGTTDSREEVMKY